jgi:hypothetical protein
MTFVAIFLCAVTALSARQAITIAWEPMRFARGYQIEIQTQKEQYVLTRRTDLSQVEVALNPGNYRVQIVAIRRNGPGPVSDWIRFTLEPRQTEVDLVIEEKKQDPEVEQEQTDQEGTAGGGVLCGRWLPVCASILAPGLGQSYAGRSLQGGLIGLTFLGVAGGASGLYQQTVVLDRSYNSRVETLVLLSAAQNSARDDFLRNLFFAESAFRDFEQKANEYNTAVAALGAVYLTQLLYSLFLIPGSGDTPALGSTSSRLIVGYMPGSDGRESHWLGGIVVSF